MDRQLQTMNDVEVHHGNSQIRKEGNMKKAIPISKSVKQESSRKHKASKSSQENSEPQRQPKVIPKSRFPNDKIQAVPVECNSGNQAINDDKGDQAR